MIKTLGELVFAALLLLSCCRAGGAELHASNETWARWRVTLDGKEVRAWAYANDNCKGTYEAVFGMAVATVQCTPGKGVVRRYIYPDADCRLGKTREYWKCLETETREGTVVIHERRP